MGNLDTRLPQTQDYRYNTYNDLCHQGDLKILQSSSGRQNSHHCLSAMEGELANHLVI